MSIGGSPLQDSDKKQTKSAKLLKKDPIMEKKRYRIAEITIYNDKQFVPQVEGEDGVWKNADLVPYMIPTTLEVARCHLAKLTYQQPPAIYHPYP